MNVEIRYGCWTPIEKGKVFHDVSVTLHGDTEMVKAILKKLKELGYDEF